MRTHTVKRADTERHKVGARKLAQECGISVEDATDLLQMGYLYCKGCKSWKSRKVVKSWQCLDCREEASVMEVVARQESVNYS
jgi:hypothetical protein